MYEYVITAGEGTMLEHGVTDDTSTIIEYMELGEELIIRPCDDNCETGQ